MRRQKMGNRRSKRLFTATAARTHYTNVRPRPQRGGIRL